MTGKLQGAIPHMVSVARLPQNGMNLKLTANEKERRALAKAHELISVQSFTAELLIKKWRKDGVKITGFVRAEITQSCVVTLEPLTAQIEHVIDAVFVQEGSKLARPPLSADGEIVIDYDGADVPETFSGDAIDVGGLAEEFFGLAIDPYPRKPGAALEAALEDAGADVPKPSPFASLVKFRKE
jgi:Large ribosomal RNA subunit accumulation protein YceD